MEDTAGRSKSRVDYEKDKKEAKKYLESRIEDFEKRLSAQEKDFFRNLKIDDIVSYNYSLEYSDKVGSISRELSKISNLIAKSDKSKDIQYIYIPYRLTNLGFKKDEYLDDGTELSQNKVAEFKEDFKNMSMNGYIIGSLIDDSSKERLIVRLKVPSNTNMLYKDDRVLLNTGYCIEIKDFKEIARVGRKILKAEADIIDRNYVDIMIHEREKALNKKLMDKININNAIKFDISGVRTQIILNRAEKVINNYIDVVPEKILEDVFNKKDGNQRNTLQIYFVSSILDNKINRNGKYVPRDNRITIGIASPNLMLKEGYLNSYLRSSLHELAHAIDYNLLPKDNKGNLYSKTDVFKKLYDDESRNVTFEISKPYIDKNNKKIPYAQKDSVEYFAEVLCGYFSKDEEFKTLVQSKVPETYKHIENIIKNY